MSNKKENKKIRSLKWPIILLALVLLVAGGRFALKSDWLLDKVRDIAVEQANKQLNGTLDIGEIRGDLLFGITLHRITLDDPDGNRVVSADSLQVGYTLPALIRAPHQLDYLRIDRASILLEQDADSTWNLQKLLPAAEPDETEPEETDPLYWSLKRLIIENSDLTVVSGMLPDGRLGINQIMFNGGAEMLESGWYGNINNFSLMLQEERLPDQVEFAMRGMAREEQISLENLVINSGRTLLSSRFKKDEQQKVDGEVSLSPLSHRDLLAYLEELPLQQDLEISISAGGTLGELELGLNVQADGLQGLKLKTVVDARNPFSLKKAELDITSLDLATLTGQEELPSLETFHFSGSGNIPFDSYEQSVFAGLLKAERLTAGEELLSLLDAEFSLESSKLSLLAGVEKQEQRISFEANAESVFDEIPVWKAEIRSPDLNPAIWLDDDLFDSSLPLSASISGSGITPENLEMALTILVEEGRIGDQPFRRTGFTGNLNPAQITGYLDSRLDESLFSSSFTLNNWRDEIPSYSFDALLTAFNANELTAIDNFPTYINGSIVGEGSGFTPETLQLKATASLDSSVVNREPIETLRADFSISDQFLLIEDATLESPIADAEFSLLQHITDFQNLRNRLDFDAEIKDLNSLAPLFGVESLGSKGTIKGRLARNADDIQEFNGELNLEDVFVDTLFTSSRITGYTDVLLTDTPEISAGIEFFDPYFGDFGVQDIKMETVTTIYEDRFAGTAGFEIINEAESSIRHRGEFTFADEILTFTTNLLDFTTPFRNLVLQEPFDITYADASLRVDTLQIQTDNADSYLKLWAPRIDSLHQDIGLSAEMLNLGVLQRTIMDDQFFDGFLSGTIQLYNTPDSLIFEGSGLLRDLRYEEGSMDSLRFSANVRDEWLDLDATGTHDNRELFNSSFTVPFVPGDPATFDDQFFDREIAGRFNIYDVPLAYWFSFLPDGENMSENTEGMLSFRSELGGLAGNPEFDGVLSIGNARFSGVPFDSLGMDIQYRHDDDQIGFSGTGISRQNRVLDFSALLPFKIDLRALEIILPDDDDELFVELSTNDFNLALFNDFVDRDQIRQIEGRLNGRVELTGPIAALEPRGDMMLSRGAVRVVQAGITITEINSLLRISPDVVTLEQFTMRSGPGRVTGSGTVALQNLEPGNIDLQFRGRQFRAANTSEYNAIVDFDSRLRGTTAEPRLEGSLSFLSGFVNLQNFGDRAIETVELEDEEPADPFQLYENMAIEMDVNFRRQFFIRNRQFLDMEIELGGQVDLLKEKDGELQMFGTVEGVRGFARPLGRNFTIDEAQVTFTGPVDNPELNVRTVYRPPQAQMDVEIYYVIEGFVQDPQFRFESEPQMELQDIISYTVFGRPFYELESWEQVVAGSGGGPSAADVALDVLLDRVEMLAAQRLGIDVVQIDNSRTGSNSNTSILTGWYMNRRTFFAVINEVSANPKTLFLLEYLLQENLELIITQGDDPRQGVDLRWKFDY